MAAGPTGLVLHSNGNLYVLTRFNNSIEVVDLGHSRPNSRPWRSTIPSPRTWSPGRPFLYSAQLTSSNGEASCSSCHIFGDLDDLGWDLGNP